MLLTIPIFGYIYNSVYSALTYPHRQIDRLEPSHSTKPNQQKPSKFPQTNPNQPHLVKPTPQPDQPIPVTQGINGHLQIHPWSRARWWRHRCQRRGRGAGRRRRRRGGCEAGAAGRHRAEVAQEGDGVAVVADTYPSCSKPNKPSSISS